MYDLLVRGAQIVDGTGGPTFAGEIGVVGERIVAVSARLEPAARRVLDAAGQVLAPGFIDAHTHDDLVVLRQGVAAPKVHQGVTTLVIGNCGFGVAPTTPEHMRGMQSYAAAVLGEDEQPWNWPTLGALLTHLRAQPLGQHARALLGHTAFSASGWNLYLSRSLISGGAQPRAR
jgi:N-acyl-D-aspartate/D-glutamate deacylase